MQSTDFKNSKILFMHYDPLVNRHKDTMGQLINWRKMKVIKYSPGETGKIMCFTSFNQDASPQHSDLTEKQKGKNIKLDPSPARWTKETPTKEAKGLDGSPSTYF